MKPVEPKRLITTDLAIIGSGLAGTAAAIFARNNNLSCSITGNTGAIAYTTGYLDLLGYLHGKFVTDPWNELKNLSSTNPHHPLAKITNDDIATSFKQFISFISDNGISYTLPETSNLQAITPAGTVKPTLCVPLTMKTGIQALAEQPPATIIGFHGLKGFSARQIVANLREIWPELSPKIVSFPGHNHGELYAEVAARSLEVKEIRQQFASLLLKEAEGNTCVGLPALLGMHNPDRVHKELQEMTGLSLFEIPTMPPSVAGIRLREMFEQALPKNSVELIPQQKVTRLELGKENVRLELHDNYGPIEIVAQTVLLATGRFLSGGLNAHFDRIHEPLLDLPVFQPESREEWYQEEYLDSKGHGIHLAGITTNDNFQPLDQKGEIIDERLFCAGIILANQDWIRQRCGAGVAISSAFKAVNAITNFIRK